MYVQVKKPIYKFYLVVSGGSHLLLILHNILQHSGPPTILVTTTKVNKQTKVQVEEMQWLSNWVKSLANQTLDLKFDCSSTWCFLTI